MKNIIEITLIFTCIIGMIFVAIYATRLFSNAATPITLSVPKPGITCASMVTSDGAAISCWKD